MLSFFLSMFEYDGDERRYEELYEKYRAPMFRVALSNLKNKQSAEDVLQEAWFRVFKYFPHIRRLSEKEELPYLITVTKNACFDYRRKKRVCEVPEEWNPPAPDAGMEDDEYLRKLIRNLPDGYGLLLEMRYIREMTNREIGEELGMNPSTVENRILKAKGLLKYQLMKEGYTL